MFRKVLMCGTLFCSGLVTSTPSEDLFKTFIKSRHMDHLYNMDASTTTQPPRTTQPPPTSYAIVESRSDEETPCVPGNGTEPKDDSNTESPLQAVFNQLAAENYPRMLEDMGRMTEQQIKDHPVYKAFYYSATKAGQNWRPFYETLKKLSPSQIRESLKLVNTFNKMAKKGGINDQDKEFLKGYQKNLFDDFQKLNDMKLSDKDKEELAEHYKKKEPHFLEENENLQRRLENVMKKFSSDEIRKDPGLLNMRHVGIDPEQFVTLRRMVMDKVKEESAMNATLVDMIRNNLGPEPVTERGTT